MVILAYFILAIIRAKFIHLPPDNVNIQIDAIEYSSVRQQLKQRSEKDRQIVTMFTVDDFTDE